jgi:hypothetical protein
MPFLNPDGSPDNAPVRGAGVFILFSPILFLVVAFFGAMVLQRVGQLKPRAFHCRSGRRSGRRASISVVIGFIPRRSDRCCHDGRCVSLQTGGRPHSAMIAEESVSLVIYTGEPDEIRSLEIVPVSPAR